MLKTAFCTVRRVATAAALVAACGLPAAFGADDVTGAIPSASNAVATVDVAGLLSSPLGQKEGWQGKLMGNYADRPLALPAYAKRLTLAAQLELPNLTPMWQLSAIDTTTKVDLAKVAATQQGIWDKVAGKTAVTTRYDVMHVELTPERVATLWPAQRQLAARLLQKGEVDRGLSDYLASGLKADSDHQVHMVLDLENAFSGASIRKSMAMGGLASLDAVEDLKKVSDGLATVRGVTLNAKVDSGVQVHAVADFAGPVPISNDMAKAFCLDVLASAGLPADQFANLDYKVSGNQIVATGPVTPAAVATMLGVMVPDASHSVVETGIASSTGAAPADATDAGATSANPAAAASQKYYRTVSTILDQLSAGQSMAANATTLRGTARKIQQLPVLNVDQDLLAWGASVVDRLNQSAMVLSAGQMNAQNAAMTIESPTAEAAYTESGYGGGDTAASRANFRNAQQQRRQAAQAERARAAEQAYQVITEASKDRADIRAKMTQKYGVEF